MRNKVLHLIVVLLLVASCKSQKNTQSKNTLDQREYSVGAVLWQQNAAEYRALCYQAFNLAKIRLDQLINDWAHSTTPKAIITDIDETVLDNSPYSGKQISLNEEFTPERWTEWVNQKSAKPVPGAKLFLDYVKSLGVEVFYISNRDVEHTVATLANMQALGFPYADKEHLLLKEETSGKQVRRSKVQSTHQILLLMGDNLSDFDQVFENSSTESRNKSAEQMRLLFGTQFIVFPNPMYGDWETKGIYEMNYDLTAKEKKALRLKKVKSY